MAKSLLGSSLSGRNFQRYPLFWVLFHFYLPEGVGCCFIPPPLLCASMDQTILDYEVIIFSVENCATYDYSFYVNIPDLRKHFQTCIMWTIVSVMLRVSGRGTLAQSPKSIKASFPSVVTSRFPGCGSAWKKPVSSNWTRKHSKPTGTSRLIVSLELDANWN